MLNINTMLQKAIQEKADTSIISNAAGPAKAKITIEMPGQDTVALEAIEEFMLFHDSGKQSFCIGIARIPFLVRTFKSLKEKIDKVICNGLAETLGR
ncbi:hypothetical protein KIAC18_000251 [Sporomusa sphaeroides]|uniref:hypothetical protein n=1 Tax=Sporomusa sphaeroides TaxID=47679 RepID=UPI003DA18AC6